MKIYTDILYLLFTFVEFFEYSHLICNELFGSKTIIKDTFLFAFMIVSDIIPLDKSRYVVWRVVTDLLWEAYTAGFFYFSQRLWSHTSRSANCILILFLEFRNRNDTLQLFFDDRDLLNAFSILVISLSSRIKSAKILSSFGLWISIKFLIYCCSHSRYCLSDDIPWKVRQYTLYFIGNSCIDLTYSSRSSLLVDVSSYGRENIDVQCWFIACKPYSPYIPPIYKIPFLYSFDSSI